MPEDFTVRDFLTYLTSLLEECKASPPSGGDACPSLLHSWSVEKFLYEDMIKFVADRFFLDPEAPAIPVLDEYKGWLTAKKYMYPKGSTMYDVMSEALTYADATVEDIWGSWR